MSEFIDYCAMHREKLAKLKAYAATLGLKVTNETMLCGYYNEKPEWVVYNDVRIETDLIKLAKENKR